MPRGDGTGPRGMGPMSGRASGYCAGYGRPGFANSGFGRGRGLGMGWGRGFRGRDFGGWGRVGWAPALGSAFHEPRPMNWPEEAAQRLDESEEKRILKNQLESLDIEISAIRKRLAEIEKGDAAETGDAK
jgi:hypothetical protein